jgi:uncharacterized protein (TIGR02246 family)
MSIANRLNLLLPAVALGLAVAAYTGLDRAAAATEHKASLEQRVKVLEDKEEIRQLYARYMHYLDHRDMVRYSELFTEDGVVLADQGKWEGRAAMQTMFQPRVGTDGQTHDPPAPMIHNVTDIVIHVNGDQARGWGKYYAFFPSKGPGERPTISGIGGYNDWLVRVNGEWKFKKREILRVDPNIEF